MKVLKKTGLVILIALVVFILWYSPSYVYRVFIWQDADYDDYNRFSSTALQASPRPLPFVDQTADQGQHVVENFDQLIPGGTLDSLLKSQETYAFLVLQKDTLQYETYVAGIIRQDFQTSFSTAKSILSLLIGLAIQWDHIESVEEPITNYLPELLERDPDYARIRIEDLLRMRSGLAFSNEIKFPIVTSDPPLTYLHPDLRYVALEKTRIQEAPDSVFRYNNYNPLLIGMILERATGKSVSQFTQEYLTDLLGFEYPSFWSTDENGFEKMESGFNAAPIDMAKFGRLMLAEKSHGQGNVLPNDWYRKTLDAKDALVFSSGHQWGYGRMWWMVLNDGVAAHPFANGRFGQFIYLCPVSDIIIVRHGLSPDNWDDDDWTTLFYSYCSTFHPN